GAIENVSLKHGGGKGIDNSGRTIGHIYDSYESHHEYEKQTFAAEGVVVTSDGEEINITLELSMSREFFFEESVSIRAGEALKDPLVINFDGSAAELTTQQFAFDIDKDGTKDQISFVSPQSGFLALDRNKDNIINDGTELFGAITGDGFHELSLGDDDNNNWIDENDSIYDQLRIWSKSENGDDSLLALGESGVGAIYLGNIATPFSLKNEENELLGQIRTSGVFLSDEGRVGTIQQVDLVV
ncbi:MAG: hypothetical protein GY705_14215, partial [Bacteroidetes bacterium]|nr:hypothetical protein [Bacteroidota bacterium]